MHPQLWVLFPGTKRNENKKNCRDKVVMTAMPPPPPVICVIWFTDRDPNKGAYQHRGRVAMLRGLAGGWGGMPAPATTTAG